MVILGIALVGFGLWAASWGVFACFGRPAPHDLLGMVTALAGLGALGLGASLLLHLGFLG